ncbi:MAG: ribulose-phosphate 3-epimerase [Caldithrix sp.]|nr:ribulose-phosphate 3-epimerase [Caldithrix sp.]
MAYLAPSILSADVLKLREHVQTVADNGADYIHVDVMDGHFVPNLTFGPFMVQAIRRLTDLPVDAHLMVTNPNALIVDFAAAGASLITVHQEACNHLDRVVQSIKQHGCRAGVSLNPATPVNTLEPIIESLDLVLIMSVNPGFGGQSFIDYSLHKIHQLKALIEGRQAPCLIQVDGGINTQTGVKVLQAGADILVAGNAIFGADDVARACRDLKTITDKHTGRTV